MLNIQQHAFSFQTRRENAVGRMPSARYAILPSTNHGAEHAPSAKETYIFGKAIRWKRTAQVRAYTSGGNMMHLLFQYRLLFDYLCILFLFCEVKKWIKLYYVFRLPKRSTKQLVGISNFSLPQILLVQYFWILCQNYRCSFCEKNVNNNTNKAVNNKIKFKKSNLSTKIYL